jgi:hypothetical protein
MEGSKLDTKVEDITYTKLREAARNEEWVGIDDGSSKPHHVFLPSISKSFRVVDGLVKDAGGMETLLKTLRCFPRGCRVHIEAPFQSFTVPEDQTPPQFRRPVLATAENAGLVLYLVDSRHSTAAWRNEGNKGTPPGAEAARLLGEYGESMVRKGALHPYTTARWDRLQETRLSRNEKLERLGTLLVLKRRAGWPDDAEARFLVEKVTNPMARGPLRFIDMRNLALYLVQLEFTDAELNDVMPRHGGYHNTSYENAEGQRVAMRHGVAKGIIGRQHRHDFSLAEARAALRSALRVGELLRRGSRIDMKSRDSEAVAA